MQIYNNSKLLKVKCLIEKIFCWTQYINLMQKCVSASVREHQCSAVQSYAAGPVSSRKDLPVLPCLCTLPYNFDKREPTHSDIYLSLWWFGVSFQYSKIKFVASNNSLFVGSEIKYFIYLLEKYFTELSTWKVV